ncbi:MAG: hypothetical protein M3O22_01070 [Pseudomonadota bacterium]|nr:hypothetical protein [Pseudomonadota bacterium]
MTQSILSHLRRPVLFAVAALFSYAGVVNLGWSGFLCAIPFIIALIWMARKWGKPYGMITLILFLAVFLPLYFLKISGSSVYFPANGKTVMTAGEACLYKLEQKDSPQSGPRTTLQKLAPDGACSHYGDPAGLQVVAAAEKVPAGTRYTIARTDVSSPDFAEQYNLYLETPLGEAPWSTPWTHSFSPQLTFEDGKPVTEADLRRKIFYYPSFLMLWPVSPWAVPALFMGT